MSIRDLKPALLKRYLEIARLVVRHGGTDWLPEATHLALREQSNDASAADADLAADLEAMGPAFIKLGQLLSTRPDIVPPRYMSALRELRDNVGPFPGEEAQAIFEEEIGVSTRTAFATFDDSPFAAASLSQVHRATLRDGTEVAVKIQRPNLDEGVSRDLDALDALARAVGQFSAEARCLDLPGIVGELRKTLLLELDFNNERANLMRFREVFERYPDIVAPAPVADFSSRRVLTMEYMSGTSITDLSPLIRTEIDGIALADQFFDAYLHQVLVEGLFHADPHPGNLLLTPERKIAVLDFGMVGRFGNRQQRDLTKLLLAIGDADGTRAAAVAEELGAKTDLFDRARFETGIAEVVMQNRNAKIGDLNFGVVVMNICRIATGCGLRLPHELTLLGKTLLNLDEVGKALDPEFDPYRTIRNSASKIIEGRMSNESLPSQVYSAIADTRELTEKLPRQLSTILDNVAGNQVSLTIELAEIGTLTGTIRKLANRITVGIVLAALIVGAALLMRVNTEFTLFGYPGLAILLFLAAAAGGALFAVAVLVDDSRSPDSH